jgi:hypothetical protein
VYTAAIALLVLVALGVGLGVGLPPLLAGRGGGGGGGAPLGRSKKARPGAALQAARAGRLPRAATLLES